MSSFTLSNIRMERQRDKHNKADTKRDGKVHPCTGTEALYRPYGLQGE